MRTAVTFTPTTITDSKGHPFWHGRTAQSQHIWLGAATRDQIVQGLGLDSPFKGASSVRKAGALWTAASGSADSDFLPSQEVLRARSRQAIRNNPLAAGALNTLVTNVIGTGLRLCPEIDREALGLSEEQATALEKVLLRTWEEWARSVECDLNRMQTFYQLQPLSYRSAKESGDVLHLAPMINRPGARLQTRVQIVEADRVSNPYYQMNTERLAGGVELDANGAPVAYHVKRTHPGDWYGVGIRSVEHQRVRAFGAATGRRNAWLYFQRVRPGQHRGIPYLASVLEQLKQIERYTDAELHASVVGGSFTVFVTSPDGQGLKPLASLPLKDAEDAIATATDTDIALDYGTIVDLDPGQEIQLADPKRPNQAFGEFVRSICQQIGAAVGMGYELLLRNFTVSYSAARANLLEAWKFFNVEREDFALSVCAPYYEIVITEAVARGFVDIPDFLEDPMVRSAVLKSSWLGPSPGQIDPVDEVNAAKLRVDAGFSTMSYETAELTGQSWETVLQQRKKEVEAMREAGLMPESSQAPVQSRRLQNDMAEAA